MSTLPANPRHELARRIIIDLAVMTAIGVFLALLSPFGSVHVPLAVRLVSWIGFAWLGYCFFRPMEALVDWSARALDLPRWGLRIAGCLIASVPMTSAVMAIGSLPDTLTWPGLDVAMGTYFSVLVIGGAVTVLMNLIAARSEDAVPLPVQPLASSAPPAASAPVQPAPAAVPVTPPAHPLIDQLPPELGSTIIALEMEDHYVRVHTALGSGLLLMRMRDAAALLGEQEGMQVHRSWWVARAAVEDVLRDGRNIRLKLARGIEAPVARAKVTELRDARWF